MFFVKEKIRGMTDWDVMKGREGTIGGGGELKIRVTMLRYYFIIGSRNEG